MENLEIQIPIPKDHVIDSVDTQTGKITLKKKLKDVLERIKTIADALNELGENDDQVITYKKLIQIFDSTSHIVNYQLAVIIVRALNEKREPNWDDSNYKWALYFFMGSSGFQFDGYDGWDADSAVGSRLCFMEKRLGLYAVAQPEFLKVFEQFMTIKK